MTMFMCKNEILHQFSGTARWKTFIPGLYYRAGQELQNACLNLGDWSKRTRMYHLLREVLLRTLADSMHKNGHRGAHGRVQVKGPERMDSRRVVLPSGLCLES